MMTETTLDQHMAVMGRVIAKFVSSGLMPLDIDSRGVEGFLGTPEDKRVFEAVLIWMLDEDIIRAKDNAIFMDGTMLVKAAQLTAKGLAIIKQPPKDGETIEKRIRSAGDDNSLFSKIGELLGSAAGGFAKSVGSG
jgi:hypothetical protein